MSLHNVKAGDILAVNKGRSTPNITLKKVARTTKTLVVCEDGSRYRIDDGYRPGGSPWDLTRAVAATEEHCHAVKVKRAKAKCSANVGSKMPDDLALLIADVIDKYDADKGNE